MQKGTICPILSKNELSDSQVDADFNGTFCTGVKWRTVAKLYRNLRSFHVRKFRAKNFHVKIFSWSTMAHKNILTTKKLRTEYFFRLASD